MHTLVVKVVVSWAERTQSTRARSSTASRLPMPAGHDDDVGLGEVPDEGVDGQPEESVLGADLTGAGAHEGHRGPGEALEHLVGADGVEGREAVEEGDGDLHDGLLLGW